MSERPSLRGLTIGDAPSAWERAGFAVGGDRLAVDGVTIHLTGDAGPRGLVSWELDVPSPRSVDGLVHDDAGEPAAARTHPNGVTAVDHLVVATPDVERTTAALAELSLTPRRTARGLRGDDDRLYRFFLLANAVVELIGPARPDPGPATADIGPATAGIGRDADRPAAFVGIAFVADALDDLVRELGDACRAPRDAVQPGRRIATLDHAVLGISVPVAVMTPRP